MTRRHKYGKHELITVKITEECHGSAACFIDLFAFMCFPCGPFIIATDRRAANDIQRPTIHKRLSNSPLFLVANKHFCSFTTVSTMGGQQTEQASAIADSGCIATFPRHCLVWLDSTIHDDRGIHIAAYIGRNGAVEDTRRRWLR